MGGRTTGTYSIQAVGDTSCRGEAASQPAHALLFTIHYGMVFSNLLQLMSSVQGMNVQKNTHLGTVPTTRLCLDTFEATYLLSTYLVLHTSNLGCVRVLSMYLLTYRSNFFSWTELRLTVRTCLVAEATSVGCQQLLGSYLVDTLAYIYR